MLEWVAKNIGYVVTIVTSIGILGGLILKPVRTILKEVKKQTAKIDMMDQDIGDMLCSQLTREHDYFVNQGFCPSADKIRIESIYNRYKSRGRNHLADHFMNDILNLPNFI